MTGASCYAELILSLLLSGVLCHVFCQCLLAAWRLALIQMAFLAAALELHGKCLVPLLSALRLSALCVAIFLGVTVCVLQQRPAAALALKNLAVCLCLSALWCA